MSDTPLNNNGSDQPVTPAPDVNNNIGTPSGAPATLTMPQNSNAPDADTQARATIPAKMVNDPQLPSQKAAAPVDANKNTPAPAHHMLYRSAQEMTGAPRVDTTYYADGNAF